MEMMECKVQSTYNVAIQASTNYTLVGVRYVNVALVRSPRSTTLFSLDYGNYKNVLY